MIHNSNWLKNDIPDKSINLIIADPPYFEVKGEFDFIWETFGDYLQDVEKWAIECKRVLADNGSLLWWGHAKKIAYSQVIFDKYFNLENNIVWEKAECQTMIGSEVFRSFMPIKEHCLFYSNKAETKGESLIFESIRNNMEDERRKAGLKTCDQINRILGTSIGGGGMAGHYFNNTKIFEIPTEEMYTKLQTTGFFKKPYSELRNEYEELKREYEEIRRPFDNIYKLTDVIKNSQETNISSQYDHDTIKPLTLTKKLIQTTTRKGDLVLIPFGGSGTEVEACINTGRKYICYEIEKKHYNTIKSRENYALMQRELF